MRDVLISIKPEYAKRIWEGTKTIEFRRLKPRAYRRCYVYESGTGEITGFFDVWRESLGYWKDHEPCYGIDHDRLMSYSRGRKIWGLHIIRARKFFQPVKMKFILDGRAPQNFRYLDETNSRVLNEQLSFDATTNEATK